MLDEAIGIFSELGSPGGNLIKALQSHLELQICERAEEAASLNERDELQGYATVKPSSEAMGSPLIEKLRDGSVDPIGRQSSNYDQHIMFSSLNKSIGAAGRPPDANITRSRPITPSDEGPADGNVTRSQLLTLDHMSQVFDEVSAEVNGTHGSGTYEAVRVKNKKQQ